MNHKSAADIYAEALCTFDNDEKAFEKALESANGGHIPAMTYVGLLYEEGKGTEQNYFEALKWFTAAAKQGNVDGIILTGLLYKDGKGVEKNSIEALKWFTLAADQGDSNGISRLYDVYRDIYGDDWEDYYVPIMEKYAARGFQKAEERLTELRKHGFIGNYRKAEYERRLNAAKNLLTRYNTYKIIGRVLGVLFLVILSLGGVIPSLLLLGGSICFLRLGFGTKFLHHEKFKVGSDRCIEYVAGTNINYGHFYFKTEKNLRAYISALETAITRARK